MVSIDIDGARIMCCTLMQTMCYRDICLICVRHLAERWRHEVAHDCSPCTMHNNRVKCPAQFPLPNRGDTDCVKIIGLYAVNLLYILSSQFCDSI